MKSNDSETQQLCFYKKLAATNRLDSLILKQQEPYPPPEYTINQIYCSQYAIAVHIITQDGLSILDNKKFDSNNLCQKSKPQTSSKRRLKSQNQNFSIIKYPLPLAFAYFETFAKEKQYDKAIMVLSQRLQRKNVSNGFVINYNLSHLYRQRNDSKRAIFFLELALKQKPFLLEAILDYSFLLSLNNRAKQALQMLRRHLGYSNSISNQSTSVLTQNSQVQSMFLNLSYREKSSIQEKQVIKIFNNKSITIQTSFNLALYFKKIQSHDKAQKFFEQIIQKLDQAFENEKLNNPSFQFQQKDQKIYFYSKINLYQIYQSLIIKFSKNHILTKIQIPKLRQKLYKLLKSLDENEANKKYPNFYKKYCDFLKTKLVEAEKNLNSQIQFICEEKQNENFKSTRYSSTDRKHPYLTELKKVKSKPILNLPYKGHSSSKPHLHSSMAVESERDKVELIKQFNKKFKERRIENQKKLKFLLLKDKQLDNFFNTLPKINFDLKKKQQKDSELIGEEPPGVNQTKDQIKDSMLSTFKTSQLKTTSVPLQQNKALINKLRKELQANNDLSKYEEEFQRKKLKYEQQFSGYNIDQAVRNIMGNLFNAENAKTFKNQNKTIHQNLISQNQKASKIQDKTKQLKEQQNEKDKKTLQNCQQEKNLRKNERQRTSPYQSKIETRRGSKQITQISMRDEIQKEVKQKESQKNLKRSASSSSKNFRIKLSINSVDQSAQQRVQNKKKQSIIQAIQNNQPEQKQKNELEAPHIKVNQIDYDQQSNNLSASLNKRFSDSIVQDDSMLEQRNKLRTNSQNILSDKNSHIESSTSLLTTHKIFVEKEKNNIEDIFEAFNPGSNRNILINQNAPTTRQQSKKTTGAQQYNTSLNNLNVQGLEQVSNLPLQFQQKYDKAAQLQTLGRYAEAFQIYTELYKKFKTDELKQMTLLGIAFNFQLQEQFQQAEKTYLKCSKYNNAQAFMKLGQLLIRQNRIQDGIENLQKANCITRFNIEIQTKLVYAYSLKKETTEKALSLAQSILKREPMSLEILIMTAKILQKQEKISQALQVCLAIDSYKESQFIKHYIGTLYMNEGNIVEAFKYFKSALTLNSNHVPSLIQIGTILSEMKPKQAISILNHALEIQPTNRFALTRLAKIYESIEQDPNKAMEIYQKTLQTKLNYQAYMKIADCQAVNGSYLEALVNYREALNLKKTHTAFRKIAEMHEYKKEYKKSVENYEFALQIIPKEHKFYEQKKQIMIQMAKDLLILQQYDPAITTLEQLLQSQESKNIYDMLGQCYFGKQEYSIALQFYEKANNLQIENQDVDLLEKIALCFDRKQQYTASKKIYQKILSINPSNISCMNNYANILLILGDTNEAFYWYEVMLQKAPKNIEKRLKVTDIYSAIGDWSKVQYHLLICYKLKEHDIRILEKLINLYKEKRQQKMVAKYEKKLALMKAHIKKKQS